MTKAELIAKLAEKAGVTKAVADRCLDDLLGLMGDTLKAEGKITLTGFGTFAVTETKARTGRNPRTGEAIKIAAGKRVGFKVGKELKELVAGK